MLQLCCYAITLTTDIEKSLFADPNSRPWWSLFEILVVWGWFCQCSKFKPFMRNVEEWPIILWKFYRAHTTRSLRYVWPFSNIMHERINLKSLCRSNYVAVFRHRFYWMTQLEGLLLNMALIANLFENNWFFFRGWFYRRFELHRKNLSVVQDFSFSTRIY